jgi:hypothetical protein
MGRREKSVWGVETGQKHSAPNKSECGNDFLHQEPVTTEGPSFYARSRTGTGLTLENKGQRQIEDSRTHNREIKMQAGQRKQRPRSPSWQQKSKIQIRQHRICGQHSGGETEVLCMQLRAGHGDTQEQAEKSPARQTIS